MLRRKGTLALIAANVLGAVGYLARQFSDRFVSIPRKRPVQPSAGSQLLNYELHGSYLFLRAGGFA